MRHEREASFRQLADKRDGKERVNWEQQEAEQTEGGITCEDELVSWYLVGVAQVGAYLHLSRTHTHPSVVRKMLLLTCTDLLKIQGAARRKVKRDAARLVALDEEEQTQEYVPGRD
jgi:hypothetical protein